MAARKFIHKPGENKAAITRDASTTSTAASVVVDVASTVTAKELVLSLQKIIQVVIEKDGISRV